MGVERHAVPLLQDAPVPSPSAKSVVNLLFLLPLRGLCDLLFKNPLPVAPHCVR